MLASGVIFNVLVSNPAHSNQHKKLSSTESKTNKPYYDSFSACSQLNRSGRFREEENRRQKAQAAFSHGDRFRTLGYKMRHSKHNKPIGRPNRVWRALKSSTHTDPPPPPPVLSAPRTVSFYRPISTTNDRYVGCHSKRGRYMHPAAETHEGYCKRRIERDRGSRATAETNDG